METGSLVKHMQTRQAGPKAMPLPPTLIQLPRCADERGALTPVEFSALPFTPQRIFVVRDVPAGEARGGHAHRTNTQALICLQGEVRVDLGPRKARTASR